MERKIQVKRFSIAALLTFVLAFTFAAVPAHSANPTKDDAVKMVESAIASHKANGKAATIDEVNKADGKFSKGPELFTFAIDLKGNVLAHPFNKKLIGQDMTDLKDADGKPFAKEMANLANSKGSGWVEYKWSNPASKHIEPKATYLQKIDDVVYCCGIYLK